VRLLALIDFAALKQTDLRLFLNVTPRLMIDHLLHRADQLPWTLQMMDEIGVDPHRVVIELTEEAVGPDTESLRHLVEIYRKHGCAIAVDDVGAEASNLDRIGYFEPDIIKIDALILRRSLRERSFRQVLKGLSAMAEGLGASLLFEGVESEADLNQALSFGARYIQGWYFSKAGPDFLPETAFSKMLLPSLKNYGQRVQRETETRKHRLRRTIEQLGRAPVPEESAPGVWEFPPEELRGWGEPACRIFLTDHSGFQVSPNYEKRFSDWELNPVGLGRCRSIRPYFPGSGDNRWSVSEVYYDVNDRTLMRTYSRPAGLHLILFVDVPEIDNRP
jgi:EAL domain-containing protein (putative c-di-GMP-specific phosphodiesterase class I)